MNAFALSNSAGSMTVCLSVLFSRKMIRFLGREKNWNHRSGTHSCLVTKGPDEGG